MKLYTSAAIARTLGISEKEIKNLTKSGVIKKGVTDRGLYRLEETAREIIANYKLPEDQRENVDYNSERAKLMRIKRKSEEYDLKIKEGQLYGHDDVYMGLSKMLVSFKSRLSAIPSRAAQQAARMKKPAEITELLNFLIEEALNELSNAENIFDDSE